MPERDDTDELPPVTAPLPPPGGGPAARPEPPPTSDPDPTEAITQGVPGGRSDPRDGASRDRTEQPAETGRSAGRAGRSSGPTPAAGSGSRADPTSAAGATASAARPHRFGPARRRALLWDAGWCAVTGLVLLVLWASDRPVAVLPDWASPVTGVAVVVWAGVLVAVAAGGVGRPATALVGAINLLVGSAIVAWGWLDLDVPTLVVVLAAQVVGFGLVQVLASVRR